MNILAKIFSALGLGPDAAPRTESRKQPSSTRSGPGRRHVQGDGKRTSWQRQAGAYGRGLRNHINRANALRLQANAKRKEAYAARAQAKAYGRTVC